MLKQIEGSQGVAEAVALCRPQVVCAYPITPQTHIVEGIGAMVKAGTLDAPEALYDGPAIAIFCAEKLGFQPIPDGLPAFDALPPRPGR